MERNSQTLRSKRVERRHFLRDSLTGSVPLLVSWVAGRAGELARLARSPGWRRKTSPPPAAADSPPAPAKQELDKHYQEFARDNPPPPEYPTS